LRRIRFDGAPHEVYDPGTVTVIPDPAEHLPARFADTIGFFNSFSVLDSAPFSAQSHRFLDVVDLKVKCCRQRKDPFLILFLHCIENFFMHQFFLPFFTCEEGGAEAPPSDFSGIPRYLD